MTIHFGAPDHHDYTACGLHGANFADPEHPLSIVPHPTQVTCGACKLTSAFLGMPKPPRFVVEWQEFWTECECPPSLCKHAPDYMRCYEGWIVWDTVRDEHAYITVPEFVCSNEYLRKRDAIAAAKAANEAAG